MFTVRCRHQRMSSTVFYTQEDERRRIYLRTTPSHSDRDFQKVVVVECPRQQPAVPYGFF